MAEHLLIADLGAPLLLVGLRNPVLAFFLPRGVLVPLARRRRAARRASAPCASRSWRSPSTSLVLYGWHLTFAFEGAVRHDLVHVLQHACFIFAGILVWWPALEPKRRRLRGELWKIGHILAARMLGHVPRDGVRADPRAGLHRRLRPGRAARGLARWPTSRRAGAMMVALDIAIMVFALAFFFWHAAQQHDRDEARRRRRGADADPRGYSTVRVPSMPPSRWPGTEQ